MVLLIDDPAPHVRRLLINRPESRNAINQPVREALFAALCEARGDAAVRAVLLGGAGGFFSAGGDLPSMVGISAEAALARMKDGHRIVSLLWGFPKPVVVAVERAAAGAAAGVALLADRIVMGGTANLLFPFLRLGLIPDWGLRQTVLRRVGLTHAARLLMDAAPVAASRAAELGLADIVADDGEVMSRAIAEAAQLAALPPAAFARLKAGLRDLGVDDPLRLAAEAEEQAACLAGPEFVEGYAAFKEKRRPDFV